MANFLTTRERPLLRAGLITSLLLSPGLVIALLIQVFFGATLFDFVPATILNDELYFWHQALTFSQVGFDGGYYTYEEIPPRSAGLVRFGAWGPAYPVLYGTLGNLMGGWQPFSGLLINILLFTLALALFIRLARPGVRQLALLQGLLLTWWPIWFYLPAASQTGLNLAMAVVMAGLFYRLLRDPDSVRGAWWPLSIAFVLAASFVVPYWALMFVPCFALKARGRGRRSLNVGLIKAAALTGVTVLYVIYFDSTYPYGGIAVTSAIEKSRGSLLEGLRTFYSRFGWNTVSMGLQLSSAFGMSIIWLKVFLLLQTFTALILISAGGLWLFRRARQTGARLAPVLQAQVMFHAYSLSGILALMLLIHYISVAYHFAPFLLILFLLLITFRHVKAISLIIVGNLLFVTLFLTTFHHWRSGAFDYDDSRIRTARQALAAAIVHQPGQNPWCNTLLTFARPFTYDEIAVIPAGIGYSAHLGDQGDPYLSLPVRSRYVLVRQGVPPPTEWGRLKWQASTTVGDLYLNLDSACGGVGVSD